MLVKLVWLQDASYCLLFIEGGHNSNDHGYVNVNSVNMCISFTPRNHEIILRQEN